jgi:hypothetical protein
MTDLPALLLALDALRGAVFAVLTGDRPGAAKCLREAPEAAAKAFPDGSREGYGLTLVLLAITEAAGATS